MFDERAEILMGNPELLSDVKSLTYVDHDFLVWSAGCFASSDTTVSVAIPGNLSLFFALAEDVHCSLGGLPGGMLRKGCFNMIFHPGVKVNCALKGGQRYVFFGLDMNVSYLQNLDPLPILSEFLTRVNKGTPGFLNREGFGVANEAKVFISEIMMEMRRGVLCQRMHMSTLLHGLVEKSLGQAGRVNDEEAMLFEQVRNYIYDNLPRVTVVGVSEGLKLSSLYLRTLIKKKVNMKPVSFIIDCRMQRGMQLLSQGMRLTEIAKQVGYSDQAAFSKAFLKRFGKWPTEVRDKMNDFTQAPEEHQFLLY